jgi:hypothetical protein
MPNDRALQELLELRAAQLGEAAKPLLPGNERDGLLHRAAKMEAASLVIDMWMSSPGATQVRPPQLASVTFPLPSQTSHLTG